MENTKKTLSFENGEFIASKLKTFDAQLRDAMDAKDVILHNTITEEIHEKVTTEANERVAQDDVLHSYIDAQTKLLHDKDVLLSKEIASFHDELIDEIGFRQAADNELDGKISAESSVRETTDTELDGKISAEASVRENADNELDGKISAEASVRETTDTELDGKISAEASVRENADNELDGKIGSLNDLDNILSKDNIVAAINSINKNVSNLNSSCNNLNRILYSNGASLANLDMRVSDLESEEPTTIDVNHEKKTIFIKDNNTTTSEVNIEDIFNVLNLGIEFDETSKKMNLTKDGEVISDTIIDIQNNNITNVINENVEKLPYIWHLSVGDAVSTNFFTDTWHQNSSENIRLFNETIVNIDGTYSSLKYIRMYAYNSSSNIMLSLSLTFIKFVLSTYEKEIVKILSSNSNYKNVKNMDDVINILSTDLCTNRNNVKDKIDICYTIHPFTVNDTQGLAIRAYLKIYANWKQYYYFDILTSKNITNSPMANRVPIVTAKDMFSTIPRFLGYFNNNNHYVQLKNNRGYSGPMLITKTTLPYYSSTTTLNASGSVANDGVPAYLYTSSTPMTPSKIYSGKAWMGDSHFDDLMTDEFKKLIISDAYSLPFKNENLCGWVMFAFPNKTIRDIVF